MRTERLFTLIFIKKNAEILLGYKTRGLGMGMWNGFGGKLEKDETVINCAKRELFEECGVKANSLKHLGVLRYDVRDEKMDHFVHVFTCDLYDGTEQASEEMNPIKWFKFKDIPYDKMWPCSPKWWPLMLNDKYFSVHSIYNKGEMIENYVFEHKNIQDVLSHFHIEI